MQMRAIRCITVLLGVVGCGPRHASPAPSVDAMIPPGFDHVIVATDSFARGVAELRAATGVIPAVLSPNIGVGQGAYPGIGSQSAIIGLGVGRYLELVGPATRADQAAPTYLAMYRRLTPIGWAIRTTSIDSVQSVLASAGLRGGHIVEDRRQTRTGERALQWRVLDPWRGVSTVPPFFVEWDRTSGRHPSEDAPAGCSLADLVLAYPFADSLRAQMNRAGVAVRVASSARQAITVTLDCPTGRVALPSSSPDTLGRSSSR